MITELIAAVGLADVLSPRLVHNSWFILAILNLGLTWITGVLYRRQKQPERWSRGFELAGLYLLCPLVTIICFLTLFAAFEEWAWDATLLWLLITWTTVLFGTRGLRKTGFRTDHKPTYPKHRLGP